MRIAIQGELDSFHDIAARQWFGDDIEIVPAESFPEVFRLVEAGQADQALVAIENTLYGSINQVYDLIERYAYPIIGEINLPIHHQLIGTPNQTINSIYSHPVALAQCENYLDENYPNAKRIEYHDTSASVTYVKQLNDPHSASIASLASAKRHNMSIIDQNIEDNPENFTRFLAIKPGGTPPLDANRASIVITTSHQPGALAKILTIFADMDINLSKLQSRPIIGRPWNYRFYLVLDTAGDEFNQAIDKITPLTNSLTVLGEYKRHSDD